MLLARSAAGLRGFGRPAPRRSDPIGIAVPIMVANPVGQVAIGASLVAALWHDVEEPIGTEQILAAASVG